MALLALQKHIWQVSNSQSCFREVSVGWSILMLIFSSSAILFYSLVGILLQLEEFIIIQINNNILIVQDIQSSIRLFHFLFFRDNYYPFLMIEGLFFVILFFGLQFLFLYKYLSTNFFINIFYFSDSNFCEHIFFGEKISQHETSS